MRGFLRFAVLGGATLSCGFALQAAPAGKPAKKAGPAAEGGKGDRAKAEKNAYDYSFPGPDGKDVPLSSYKGKFLVIVNLGRKSGYADQLAGLEKLYETYKGKGLVVIGIPSDDFGAAEPGSGAEVRKAYTDAKVNFPVMNLSKVSGDDALPVFGYLTKSKGAPAGGAVHWNYTKFVVDGKGNVIARLDPDVAPDSVEMLATIDQILDGRFKPKKAGGKPGGKPEADDDDEE